eukprot:361207-Chlamydomonas_euryale.AAC.5
MGAYSWRQLQHVTRGKHVWNTQCTTQYTNTSLHGRAAARRHKSTVGRKRSVKDNMLINNRAEADEPPQACCNGAPMGLQNVFDEASKAAFVEAVQHDHDAHASATSMN